MPYIQNTPRQIQEMLDAIGVSRIDELYRCVPAAAREDTCPKGFAGLSEMEAARRVSSLAKKNCTLERYNSFLGAGIYDHYVPAALKHLLSRSEFYTAYTPYQPECSQGALQAIYEYQSYICLLTGMDVSNASLYDGASALSEAVLMALRVTGKKHIYIAETVHPEYRETLRTYCLRGDVYLHPVGFTSSGTIDVSFLDDVSEAACVVVQSPNFFGLLESFKQLRERIASSGVLLIMVTNPFSLAVLKTPAALGVDIVCGDGQPLGGAAALGGETFGFLAARSRFLRQLPGRIVGKTIDRDGRTAYCLTLQTREQHIRREKATSNICSNHSLNAIGAAVYLSLMGKSGFRDAACQSCYNARYLYGCLSKIRGVSFPLKGPFFNEFVWNCEREGVERKLYERQIIPGLSLKRFYPRMKDSFLSACTEKKTKDDLDSFAQALEEVVNG